LPISVLAVDASVRTRIPARLSEISTLQLVGSGLGHVGKRRVLARQPFFRVQLAQVLHNGSTRGVPASYVRRMEGPADDLHASSIRSGFNSAFRSVRTTHVRMVMVASLPL
jgi:hypothetical protein